MENSSDCPHYTTDKISIANPKKFVYKEECAKCFKTQKDDQGINLCLTCLMGGCDDHTKEHYEKSQHSLYLNFKQVLIPVEHKEEKPREITKLAIGVPGGAELEDENRRELKTRLFCQACQKDLDQEKFKDKIEALIKSESAETKNEKNNWELQLTSCAHVETMVQSFDKKELGKPKCNNCDLTKNLWLCLFCGNMGCGRGSKEVSGNGHALQHFKETAHSVVVNIGTISPDGSASLFCYGCDDDIRDDKLSVHLATFGMNISKLEKTELSIAELNIQANNNLTLASVIEHGKEINPVFGKGYTGMQNLGNSCYMNSVLQSVFSIEEFQERYHEFGYKHLQHCKSYTPECLICQLSKVGYGLFSGKYSEKKETEPIKVEGQEELKRQFYQDGIRPYMFKMLVGRNHNEFSSNRQQDASEYLKHLFKQIQIAEKKEGLDDITKLFEFQLVTKFTCTSCNGYKLNEVQSQDIDILIPKSDKFKTELDAKKEEIKIPQVDFKECLQYSSTEHVELRCSNCKQNKNFIKSTFLQSFPKYLLVSANRIKFNDENWQVTKDITNINFENSDYIDLGFYRVPGAFEGKELEDSDAKPAFDESLVENLQNFGFSSNAAKRALIANNNNLDAALNWLFEKAGDPSIEAPLEDKKNKGAKKEFSPEVIQSIAAMGFSEQVVKYALEQTDGNPDRAVDYLFNHPDIMDNLSETKEEKKNPYDKAIKDLDRPIYTLQAVVLHLGQNYQSGHYVSYVKKDGKWVYFNDAKVAETSEPAIGKGTIFLLRRVDSDPSSRQHEYEPTEGTKQIKN